MAIKFFEWLRAKNGKTGSAEVSCRELFEAAQDFRVRNAAFNVCVNMIANAIGRCEFKTYIDGKAAKGAEYYLWNCEPNANQNSTVFLHKLIYKLCMENEALVIGTRRRDGREALVVADGWTEGENYPSRQNEYKNVTVGDMQYDKTFKEADVLHFKLNNKDVSAVTDGLFASYCRLVSAAAKNYEWGSGQHWKVHVSQLAQGGEDWAENFRKMIEVQFKPFLESGGAVLPEFDGYKYENAGGTGGGAAGSTRDIKALVDDIYEITARAFQIPSVLVQGQVEGTQDANGRFLTYCIDPICDQLQEEIVRKRYGFEKWRAGTYLRIDSSSIIHFDLFANAANVEKLVGSGVFSINDIRAAAGQAPIDEPWANAYYMTRNIAGMETQTTALTAGKGGE